MTSVIICQIMTFVKGSITTEKVTGVIISLLMEKSFIEWLDENLEDKGWSGSELSRRSGISQSAISLVLSGRRQAGIEFCDGIAKAFKLPPDQVYRIAGILPLKPNNDETVSEIVHIYHLLNDNNQDDLLDYAKNRLSKQEREAKKSGKRIRVG